MSNDSGVLLGTGLATGMFFHAPVGTAFPTYPTEFIGTNGDGTSTDKFTATSGQSTFSLSSAPEDMISMTVDGVAVASTDYSVSGSTLTYSGSSLTGGEKVAITYTLSDWKIVGDVTSDGITVATDKSTEALKNWANVIKRVIMTEHTETIQAPIMTTDQEVLETVLGSDNVTATAANSKHGKLLTAGLSSSELPDPENFLFLMKDGDDTMALCCKGQIMSMENVTFAPGAAINWNPTITCLDNSLTFIEDDGQTTP